MANIGSIHKGVHWLRTANVQTLIQTGEGFGVMWSEEKRAHILVMCQEKSKKHQNLWILLVRSEV